MSVSLGRQCLAHSVWARVDSDRNHGFFVLPLQLSSSFTFETFGAKRPFADTRSWNPTRGLLAEVRAELELLDLTMPDGIPEGLPRHSVGLEAADDFPVDLTTTLARVSPTNASSKGRSVAARRARTVRSPRVAFPIY